MSRGGNTCKIQLICDSKGRPLHFELAAGQRHESSFFDDVMIGADEALRSEDGEPVAWPLAMACDKGYRYEWVDRYLLDLEIKPVIPSKKNEDRSKRPVDFDKEMYRRRNIVERLIGWLKRCRRVCTRYEKTAMNFAGMIRLAMIRHLLGVRLPRN